LPYFRESYPQALHQALPLITETLDHPLEADDARVLLAAALKGSPSLGQLLAHLDCICGECTRCGVWIYPEELQQALG